MAVTEAAATAGTAEIAGTGTAGTVIVGGVTATALPTASMIRIEAMAMAMAAGAAVLPGGGIGVAGAAAGGVASEAAAAARRIVGGEVEREVGTGADGGTREDRGIEVI
jgi:hypothetical protein